MINTLSGRADDKHSEEQENADKRIDIPKAVRYREYMTDL